MVITMAKLRMAHVSHLGQKKRNLKWSICLVLWDFQGEWFPELPTHTFFISFTQLKTLGYRNLVFPCCPVVKRITDSNVEFYGDGQGMVYVDKGTHFSKVLSQFSSWNADSENVQNYYCSCLGSWEIKKKKIVPFSKKQFFMKRPVCQKTRR